MIILTTMLVNILERYGPIQVPLFLAQGAKYFETILISSHMFFQPIELCFNDISTGEQGEPRTGHYRGFSI